MDQMTICHMKGVAHSDDPISPDAAVPLSSEGRFSFDQLLFWFLWSTTFQFLFRLTVLIHDVFQALWAPAFDKQAI